MTPRSTGNERKADLWDEGAGRSDQGVGLALGRVRSYAGASACEVTRVARCVGRALRRAQPNCLAKVQGQRPAASAAALGRCPNRPSRGSHATDARPMSYCSEGIRALPVTGWALHLGLAEPAADEGRGRGGALSQANLDELVDARTVAVACGGGREQTR